MAIQITYTFYPIYKNPVAIFIATITMISFIQWCSIRFLAYYCAVEGFLGFLYNFMSLGSPICMFVNTLQYHISTYYVTVWTSAAISILTYYGLKK